MNPGRKLNLPTPTEALYEYRHAYKHDIDVIFEERGKALRISRHRIQKLFDKQIDLWLKRVKTEKDIQVVYMIPQIVVHVRQTLERYSRAKAPRKTDAGEDWGPGELDFAYDF